MSAIDRLGHVSRAYELAAAEYRDVAVRAASCEAEHKVARAKAILRFKTAEERVSHAEAETRAEADDVVAGLYQDRMIASALADSHRERLRQLREQVATGRTLVASEREVDRIHAGGLSGAA